MARLILHKNDRVAFLDRKDVPSTGRVKVLPWGRRTWAVIRNGQLHRVPRSRIISVVECVR